MTPFDLRLVALDGGPFLMGTEDPTGYAADGEGPVREVTLAPFSIGRYAVTNAEFARFVAATGFVTAAEQFGWSFVFAGLLPDDFEDTAGVQGAEWWRQVFGATWRTPEGPHSTIEHRGDHPVVHVSHDDAVAYCRWVDARLPTEAEWEYAARGGLDQRRFPWGDDLEPDGVHMMNVFQGDFPAHDTGADGWIGTCPVDAFPANGHGLHNLCGNVWEWCADWFTTRLDTRSGTNPTGAAFGTHRVIRGGSYLCHDSYCNRYRVAARTASTPDSSTGHQGFRVARTFDAIAAPS